jgi:hypothetical protein
MKLVLYQFRTLIFQIYSLTIYRWLCTDNKVLDYLDYGNIGWMGMKLRYSLDPRYL